MLAIVLLFDLKSDHSHFNHIVEVVGKATAGLAFAVTAFVAGQFLDALRNLIEELISIVCPKHAICWAYIWEFSSEKLDKMDDFYFTYYVFDFNLALALVFGLASQFLPSFSWHLPVWVWYVAVAALSIFVLDALSLRADIVRLSKGVPPRK